MRSLSQSFYSQLPETAETQLARNVSELQSQVTTIQTHSKAVFPNLRGASKTSGIEGGGRCRCTLQTAGLIEEKEMKQQLISRATVLQ